MSGPMQIIVAAFEGDVTESHVIDELFAATEQGDIQLLDLLVVEKDEQDQVWAVDVTSYTDEDDHEIHYGAVVSGLIDMGAAAEDSDVAATLGVADVGLGLSPIDINHLVHQIPAGSSAVVCLFEHSWAAELQKATQAAGGMMIAQGMINPAGLLLVGKEVEAAREAIAVIESARAIEAEAMLEAAEAVAMSEAIQEEAMEEAAVVVAAAEAVEHEAAVRAVRAMIAAEVIEEEAAREAVEALVAARMIEEAAAEAAAEAVLAAEAA